MRMYQELVTVNISVYKRVHISVNRYIDLFLYMHTFTLIYDQFKKFSVHD